MRLRPEQLASQLTKQLLPVYLLSGDELLIQQECADAIRQHCRQQGIVERDVLEAERGFDWNALLEAGQSLSLFADRKLIELRLGGARMDQKSSAALQQYLEHADGSNILLITCGRLDSRSLTANRPSWRRHANLAGRPPPARRLDTAAPQRQWYEC